MLETWLTIAYLYLGWRLFKWLDSLPPHSEGLPIFQAKGQNRLKNWLESTVWPIIVILVLVVLFVEVIKLVWVAV